MKRILLFVTTMMFVAVAAMAQPHRGPQGPRGPHMMPRHRGPRVAMKLVKLTDEEVAAKFARTLRLDEAKTAAFAPVFVEFLTDKAEVNKQYPAEPRQMFKRPMHKEQLTETQKEEIKAQHKQMSAKRKVVFKLHNEYKPQFLEVLSGRQYHRMMGMLDNPWMYVKFVRVSSEEDENKQPETTSVPEGIADAIKSVNSDKAGDADEWYSVNGVRQNGQPSQSGIYVKNGKKVLVK